MTRPTLWIARIQHEDGHIYLSVTAEFHGKRGDKFLEVYREYDDGHAECRNLYTSLYCGRVVAFPGDRYDSYYGGGTVQEEEWGDCAPIKFWNFGTITDDEIATITDIYPTFGKYVIKKMADKDVQNVIRVLAVWLEHPEVEHIIAAGYNHVALTKSFWTLSEKRRHAVCVFMRQHPGCNYVLRDINLMISRNITCEQCKAYRESEFKKWNYDTYLYLCKQAEHDSAWRVRTMYEDYLKMLKTSAHNIKENYWRYPTSLYEAHNRLVEEKRKEEDLRRRAENVRYVKEKADTYKALKKRAVLWPELVIDGYTIHASADAEEWLNQAHTLHQCIVSCSYDEKMAHCQGDIIFIKKEGEPVATAQVFGMNRIGQFYADEHSLSPGGSLPSDEVRAAFDEYMVQAKAWRKAKRARRAA